MTRRRNSTAARTWRGVLAVSSSSWVVSLGLAAFAAGRPAKGPLMYASTTLVYAIGSVVCHQRPERSFHLLGAQLPVCARCTGLYVGAAVAACLAMYRAGAVHAGVSARRARLLVFAAATPTVLTLVFEWATALTPSHWLRAVAGFTLGAAVLWVIAALDTPRATVEVH